MNFKTKTLPIVLALAGAFGAAQAGDLEFHGYFRVQGGTTDKGGNLVAFQAPGAQAKYRLGNEADSYAEPSLTLNFGDQNAAWAKWKLTSAIQQRYNADWQPVNDGADPVTGAPRGAGNISIREDYLQAGGFFGKGALENATLWVGQRFYNRHDVHINDYYYWTSGGPGAGIEGIAAGSAKAAVAYFQNGGNGSDFNNTYNANTVVNKRFQVRLYEIATNSGGSIEGEFVHTFDSTPNSTASKGSGNILFLQHTQSGVAGGWNKLAFITGNGQGGSGLQWLPVNQGTGNGAGDKGKQTRFVDQLFFDLKNGWSGLATAAYSDLKKDNGDFAKWTSFGVRPQLALSKTSSIAFEVGHDSAKANWFAGTSQLSKISVAPQYSLDSGFWSRPVLRAYATYAKWNDVARTAGIANGVFGTKTSGMQVGVQGEAWW